MCFEAVTAFEEEFAWETFTINNFQLSSYVQQNCAATHLSQLSVNNAPTVTKVSFLNFFLLVLSAKSCTTKLFFLLNLYNKCHKLLE